MADTLQKYPRISIVTPCYNSEQYLEETIKSVLSQDYPNLEYIIVDGGSTDGTLDIIKRYENRLAYWISEKDNGMYEALQKGFEKSTGDLMAWIGSDDMYHPKSFFTVAEIFSRFDWVKWLVGSMTSFDELGRTTAVIKSRRFYRYDFLNGDYKWLQQESCFWHRSLWELSGSKVDATLNYAGDFELWIRFFRHEYLHVTSALIGGFRKRKTGQLSHNMQKYEEEVTEVINRECFDKKDQLKFSLFKIFKKTENVINRLGFVRSHRLIRAIYKQYYADKTINFDPQKQEYIYGKS